MNYEILADVSIDLDPACSSDLDIKFIPMEYMIGEETRMCTQPENDEMMHSYYDKLRNKVTTRTSQITPFHYEEAFRPYVEAKKPLIYISLSSGLSKTYESALMAVENLKDEYDDVQIEVVDSLSATGGMGLLTETACQNRAAGMSMKENAALLREKTKLINHWFKVEDLMYLSRGGRVSGAAAVIGTALNIKPILYIKEDGTLDTIAKKRGNKLAVKYMLDQFERNFDPTSGDIIYIVCADCKDEAEKLKKQILEKNPALKIRITMLSPIIGAHTGPDLLAIVYYGTSRC